MAVGLPNTKHGHAQHAFGAFKGSFAQVPPLLLLVFVQVRRLLTKRRVGIRTDAVKQACAQGRHAEHLVKVHGHRIRSLHSFQRGLVAF